MGRRGSSSTHIAATPEAVYGLITDLSRMGEWSPETTKATWVGDATGPVAGAKFKGTNKLWLFRWSTTPTVEVAEPGREFTFVTTNKDGSTKYTRWSYVLTPAGDGTDVTESWDEIAGLPVIGGLMMNDRRAKQLTDGCAQTLARIKAAAES